MATITFQAFCGAGPAWADIGANTFVFSSSPTVITDPVTVLSYQDGTHLGAGDPGADQCGANHMNNVKYLTDTTMSVNGGGSEDITDANLANDECTMRLHFNDASLVIISAARFYCFNGSSVSAEAEGVTVYAFERGVSEASGWTLINNDSGNIGGDNTGERLDLGDKGTPATDHYYYIAMSVAAQTVGQKTNFDVGVALTYS